EPQHLAPVDREVDAVDRPDGAGAPAEDGVAEAAPDREVDLEVVEAQQLGHGGGSIMRPRPAARAGWAASPPRWRARRPRPPRCPRSGRGGRPRGPRRRSGPLAA